MGIIGKLRAILVAMTLLTATTLFLGIVLLHYFESAVAGFAFALVAVFILAGIYFLRELRTVN